MNIRNEFLSEVHKMTRKVAVVALASLCFVGTVYAADDNGCDDSDNNYITPELALCSTHVYNIGLTQNSDNEANKQIMRDVVALKSTVMMQQMYKQYEYLEATLSRLKTQLEREILTTKLEAAGALPSSSSGSASSASTDRNVVLIGAENCLLKTSTSDGLACIQSNIRIVLQAVSAGNIGEAYRQLQKDLSFAEAFGVTGVKSENGVYTAPANCADLKATRDKVNNCAYALNIAVMTKIEEQQNQQRNNQQQFR